MYSEEVKNILFNRIGWCESSNDAVLVVVDSDNQTSESGRFIRGFHQLCSVDNIYSSVSVVNMEAVEFNALLSSIRKESVEEVITNVFDLHPLYLPATDYSSIISQRPRIFDDAIGYCMAIKILEMFVSTNRKNFVERNAKLSFQSLKIELEGAKNAEGHQVVIGIKAEKHKAIQQAQKIIFPDPYIIDGDSLW